MDTLLPISLYHVHLPISIAKRKARPTDGLPSWNWPIRPEGANAARSASDGARAAITEGTIEVTQPRTVASEHYNGAEGTQAAAAAARVRDQLDGAHRLEKLKPETYAMVKMTYPPDSPGNHVPLLIVQLPPTFGDVDTTKEDADIRDVSDANEARARVACVCLRLLEFARTRSSSLEFKRVRSNSLIFPFLFDTRL